MEQSLENHRAAKLSQDEADTRCSPTVVGEMGFGIKKLFRKEPPVPDGLTGEVYQI